LLEDGEVRIFPEREEILISDLSLGCVTLHGIGAMKLKVSHYVNRLIPGQARFLKLESASLPDI